ncbi:phage holin family protein [Pectobacterium punjabense]|uniref:phage holin family protein n=1 Tax=Pectobacterium punjabense TaxID=2108399 RepID=UPI00380C2FBF
MCSLVAYYINNGLSALGWDSNFASMGSVFIGFLGIDYISSILRALLKVRLATLIRRYKYESVTISNGGILRSLRHGRQCDHIFWDARMALGHHFSLTKKLGRL